MWKEAEILKHKGFKDKTQILLEIHEPNLNEKIDRLKSGICEVRIPDSRTITSKQRAKIFATIKDIGMFTGDHPEDIRAWLLYDYCISTGEIPFSLSNCSISTAREFITFIIDFILKENIPLSDAALNRTEDIDRYLWGCVKYKRCCICGKSPSDLHHYDSIGMGNDRTTLDDSLKRKIQLCRVHHEIAHKIGRDSFGAKYHVYGIIYKEE